MKTDHYNGFCICIKCGTKVKHERGQPCKQVPCPKCGKKMLKEGEYHHQLYVAKMNKKL